MTPTRFLFCYLHVQKTTYGFLFWYLHVQETTKGFLFYNLHVQETTKGFLFYNLYVRKTTKGFLFYNLHVQETAKGFLFYNLHVRMTCMGSVWGLFSALRGCRMKSVSHGADTRLLHLLPCASFSSNPSLPVLTGSGPRAISGIVVTRSNC